MTCIKIHADASDNHLFQEDSLKAGLFKNCKLTLLKFVLNTFLPLYQFLQLFNFFLIDNLNLLDLFVEDLKVLFGNAKISSDVVLQKVFPQKLQSRNTRYTQVQTHIVNK